MNIKIRSEKKQDYNKITEINNLAFGQKNEGKLIENLRKTDNFITELSLIAENDNEMIGHILFYPVIIKSENTKYKSLALAPMSVIPKYQRKGVGTKLVIEGLNIATKLGYESVIVLGHSEYYPKFGFKPASKWNIKAPFEVPDNVFLALELKANSLKDKSGIVEYPKEFNEVWLSLYIAMVF